MKLGAQKSIFVECAFQISSASITKHSKGTGFLFLLRNKSNR